MAELEFDEALARQLEAMYGRRDVLRRRRLVHEALGARPGDHVLDLGCGPGFYAAEVLAAVGDAGRVTAVDQSGAMLAMTGRRCGDAANVALVEADATALPLDDASVDRALSVQVLEYVPDVPAALRELRRVVRPGGALVLWDVDWTTLSFHSGDPERNARVLAVWDRHLIHPALPRTLRAQLVEAGFGEVEVDGHAFVATGGHDPEAYATNLLELIPQFAAGLGEPEGADARAWADEQAALAERGEFYCCVVGCRVTARVS